MKKMLLFAMLLIAVLARGAEAEINLWAEEKFTKSNQGKWRVETTHGRVVFAGTGDVNVNFPKLNDATSLEFFLHTEAENPQKIKLYSKKLFKGQTIYSSITKNLAPLQIMIYYGASYVYSPVEKLPNTPNFIENIQDELTTNVNLFFTTKYDFPLQINDDFSEISLFNNKSWGSLGVLYSKEGGEINSLGKFEYIKMKQDGKFLYLFSPDFNLKNIDNMLLIKKIIGEQL